MSFGLLLLSPLLLAGGGHAFYLPGVVPQAFEEGNL
jgi:hypothetical protein